MTDETSSVLSQLGLDEEDLKWTDLALCAGVRVSLFYEEYEAEPRKAKLADEICLSCPVRNICLASAVENGEWGCWGGVYLVNGKMDEARNAHKTPDIWEEIRKGIAA